MSGKQGIKQAGSVGRGHDEMATMRRFLRGSLWVVGGLVLGVALALWVNMRMRLPQREGTLSLPGLQAEVSVRYDRWGVPHVRAANEADLYRALGYVHAQDRWFQMEMLRRLARGELAEVLGPKLLPTDRLFRTLTVRQWADTQAQRLNPTDPSTQALQAYLDGVNHFVTTGPLPLEFQLLGLPRRPFAAADTLSVASYLAYSFANALRTEPVFTQIRDQLGPAYLSVIEPLAAPPARMAPNVPLPALTELAQLGLDAADAAGLPLLEGSNAWAVSGARSRSGRPMLAGDPHIGFAVPSVWYEAGLEAPGFTLHGHFAALIPMALLGHNAQFGWSLTMFQNDDMDLIAEQTSPDHPGQVRHHGAWVAWRERQENIAVKGQEPVPLTLRHGPHGPIVNDALPAHALPASTPIALWWTLLESDNPLLRAFYQLNRADTLDKARQAASQIHAPGLNIVWANAAGDIAYWSAARLPIRPAGVNPHFVLDGSRPEADKLGWLPFSANPQQENPSGGLIVSANQAPTEPVPGYYAPPDRARWLTQVLADPDVRWDSAGMQRLQLAHTSDTAPEIAAALRTALGDPDALPEGEQRLLALLARWDGRHGVNDVAPTLHHQWLYEVLRAAMSDELGPAGFDLLLRTRRIESIALRLLLDPASPWWDRRDTPQVQETRTAIAQYAWRAAVAHLRSTFGNDPATWRWGRAHTLTHVHPLGRQAPLDRVFNVGPLEVAGGREVPNQHSFQIGSAPWRVTSGPSTRRVIDWGDLAQAQGSTPVGQSGAWGDPHYADQAAAFAQGRGRSMGTGPWPATTPPVHELRLQP